MEVSLRDVVSPRRFEFFNTEAELVEFCERWCESVDCVILSPIVVPDDWNYIAIVRGSEPAAVAGPVIFERCGGRLVCRRAPGNTDDGD
jgi:hypothetical protein